MSDPLKIGKRAYEAWAAARRWRDEFGVRLPLFELLDSTVRHAWIKVAQAIEEDLLMAKAEKRAELTDRVVSVPKPVAMRMEQAAERDSLLSE